MQNLYRIIILPVILLMTACAGNVGYNSILFHTRSNVGLDFSQTPPTSEITIAREEGVIEPSFEGGKTLPVEASFKTGSDRFSGFFLGIDQTFATGEAAVAMTALYRAGDAVLLKPDATTIAGSTLSSRQSVILADIQDRTGLREYSGLQLSAIPQDENGQEVQYLQPGQVKPLTFITKTSLGAGINWTGNALSGLHVGYKRKELAWAPVSLSQENSGYRADTPSLLATINSDMVADTDENQGNSVRWTQYFATGEAATNLALRLDIRTTLLKDALPGINNSSETQRLAFLSLNRCAKQIENTYLGKLFYDANKQDLITPTTFRTAYQAFSDWKKNQNTETEQGLKMQRSLYLAEILAKVYQDIPANTDKMIQHADVACLLAPSPSIPIT